MLVRVLRSPLLLVVLAGLAGCVTEIGKGSNLTGNVEVSPSLLDMGTVAVNTTKVEELTIAATSFDVRITDINVLDIDGSFITVAPFSDLLPDLLAQSGASADEEATGVLVLSGDSSITFPVTYTPGLEGYHRAQVVVTSNDLGGEINTEVRGHGATPSATCFPWVVDFGAVDVGTSGSSMLTIENESALELAISGATFGGDPGFAAPDGGELVAPNGDLEYALTFTPVSTGAAAGTMAVTVGDEVLCTVTLRGNDCRNGSPEAYDVDSDGFTSCGGDCDDDEDRAYPGGIEAPDGIDNDCDGVIDDGTAQVDDDEDGFCDHPAACSDGSLPGDCNDGDPQVNPGAEENPVDGIDNDCDGVVDGGSTDRDADGYSEDGGDCDDTEPNTYPLAMELPDGLDNDCDDIRDEGTVLFDDDLDGFCESDTSGTPCTDGTFVGDCNDTAFTTNPNAPELEDWQDNNCEGHVDEGTGNYDDDGDGYTENAVTPDCNDEDPDISPANPEIPGNGIDDDCNTQTPIGEPQ